MNTTKFQVESCHVYYAILQNKPLSPNDKCYRTSAGFCIYECFFRRVHKIAKSVY